jgi:hypothetical protein
LLQKGTKTQGLEMVQIHRYFNESDTGPERLGKVIGDILAALVVLGVLALLVNKFILN